MVEVRRRKWTKILHRLYFLKGFPGASNGKEYACNVGDVGSIPGFGRSSRDGNGNLFQYSCLENKSFLRSSIILMHPAIKDLRLPV